MLNGSLVTSFFQWSKSEGFLTEQEAQLIENKLNEPLYVRSTSVSLSMRPKSVERDKQWQSVLGVIVNNQPDGDSDQAAIEESLLHSFGSYLMDSVALENGYRGRISLLARELRHVIKAGISDLRCSFELPEVFVSPDSSNHSSYTIKLKLVSPSSMLLTDLDAQEQESIFKIACMIVEGAAIHLIREFNGSDEEMPITLTRPLEHSNTSLKTDSDWAESEMVLEDKTPPAFQESLTLLTFEPKDLSGDIPPTNPPTCSLSLPPAIFGDLFPFHIALDQSCRIIQVGRLLHHLIPSLQSTLADRFLTLRSPCSEWSFDSLVQHSKDDAIFSLMASGVSPHGVKPSDSIPSSIALKGQFILIHPSTTSPSTSSNQAEGPPPNLVFIGSPRFVYLEDIHTLGLTLNDLPKHDASRDLAITQHRTEQLALALSEVREREKDLTDAQERARAREAKLFASNDDSTAELFNENFNFSQRLNRDSDSQALFVMSPVTRGDSTHYSHGGGSHGGVDAEATATRLLRMRSGGMSESGRPSSRLNIGSRANDLSIPLYPAPHMTQPSPIGSPHACQVDMDTPANKLLKMMDGIMSGHGVFMEDAIAIQEAVAGGGSKWHEPINLKEQLKMSGMDDDVNQSLRQLLEGKDEEEDDEDVLCSPRRGGTGEELCNRKLDCESINEDPPAPLLSAAMRKDSAMVPMLGGGGGGTDAPPSTSPSSSSRPQTLDLAPRSHSQTSRPPSTTDRSVPLPSSPQPPPVPLPSSPSSLNPQSPSEPSLVFQAIPSVVSLQSWTKDKQDKSSSVQGEATQNHPGPKPSDHVRFLLPSASGTSVTSSVTSATSSASKKRLPPKKQGSWGEAAMLTARAVSLTSNVKKAVSSSLARVSNHEDSPTPTHDLDTLIVTLDTSPRASLDAPRGLSYKASIQPLPSDPSAANTAGLNNFPRRSMEALENGVLSSQGGQRTRARRMSIPCPPFETTADNPLDPSSSKEEEEILKGGVGSGRRSSLTSSDAPVHHHQAGRTSPGYQALSPAALLNSQSEARLGNPMLHAIGNRNASKRSSLNSGANSISLIQGVAILAKQARCKVLSIMVTVDESFSIVHSMAAGTSSIDSYTNPSGALNFNLAPDTRDVTAKGLSAALRLLQGKEGYNISQDSYTGSFELSLTPPREPSDHLNLILAQLDAWQFDTFALDDVTDGHALSCLGFALIKRTDAFRKFKMDEPKLARFLIDIEAGYSDTFVGIRYHSAVHAADVLRTLHAICTRGGVWVQAQVTDIGILSMYLSAVVHDYEHRGVNNDFLTRVSDPLALLYNDRSPMENHHCSASWMLLREHNFLGDKMSWKVLEKLRKTVVDMVLSTDMKQHFTTTSLFQAKMACFTRPPPISPSVVGSDHDKDKRRGSLNRILSTESGGSKQASFDGRALRGITEQELSAVLESNSRELDALDGKEDRVGLTTLEFDEAIRSSEPQVEENPFAVHPPSGPPQPDSSGSGPSIHPIDSDTISPPFSVHLVTLGHQSSSLISSSSNSRPRPSSGTTADMSKQAQSTRLHQPTITPAIIHRSGKSFSSSIAGKGGAPGSPVFSTLSHQPPGWRQDRSGSGTLHPGSPHAVRGSLRPSSQLGTLHSLHNPSHTPGGHHPSHSGVSSPRYNTFASNVQAKTSGVQAGVNSASGGPMVWDDEGRHLAMQMALKWADVGHLASPLLVHQKWVRRLEEEMFMQGDQERLRGLPVSALMDRTKGQGITKSQTGFFNFVALPMYNTMVAAFPSCTPLLEAVKANYAFWEKREAEAKAAGGASQANH